MSGRRDGITGKARLAGVMGWPVAHSLSPRLHGYWLEKYDIDGVYVPLAVTPDDLARAVAALPALGFAGSNLTLPHKEKVLPFLASVSATADRVGAVNTIIVDAEGCCHGHNTDAEGYVRSLDDAVGPCVFQQVVLLGAGGAARAVAVGLIERGTRSVRIANRTRERAEALARALAPTGVEATVVSWPPTPADLAGADLLVNTTNLGMTGQPPLTLSLDGLPTDALVSDIVYVPIETDLLRAARDRGHRVADGLGMLLHQARAGFAAWFGVEPDVDAGLRAHMLAVFKGD